MFTAIGHSGMIDESARRHCLRNETRRENPMSVFEIATPQRIGPHSNGMLMTPEEFDAIDDWEEGYRYELVRGVLIVSPPAGAGERGSNDKLGYLIRQFRAMHSNGGVMDDTLPSQDISTPTSRRRADRAIWVGLGRAPVPGRDVPTIAIEFVSASNRDRQRDYIEKRKEYAAAGIEQYWIIDPFRRRMTVCFKSGAEQVIAEGETFRTDLLPGFELPLCRLLEVADRYAAAE